ncbi:fatty acid hydroxylase domain-containing protein 2-like [Acanthaster planci]|uniref:Fatty acid hydroxylase domain-containing protein 2-like n=1 Tax=Acanthaster planci TaxID=133434 RepID=A0A8B7XHR6_ACAPL|nr:fatty acid hydroxylase domain-containing protein 2-like [Acanthaster planci]
MECATVREESCCAGPSRAPAKIDTKPQEAKTPQAELMSQWADTIKKVIFIVGGAVIVFAAACNSLTWHLQSFWGASGDFWNRQWMKVYHLFGGNLFMLEVVGTQMVTFVFYWLFNAFFLFVDITGKPAFILKYKIQDDQNTPVPWPKLRKALQTVLFNQFFVNIPFAVFLYVMMQLRGCNISADLPTFKWVLVELGVFLIFEEIGFYYFHRLLHHPRMYKHFHKKHHEWTAPIGVTAIYAHPLEHVLANMLPPVIGPLLMGSHVAVLWVWFLIVEASAIVAHCGYHLPLLPSPEAHDFHHLKFTNCYGTLGILDRLHGTDNLFRESKNYPRHILLLGLVPLSQTFPDDPKQKRKDLEGKKAD